MKNVSRLLTSGAFMHEIVSGMVASLIRLSSSDPSSNPGLLNFENTHIVATMRVGLFKDLDRAFFQRKRKF